MNNEKMISLNLNVSDFVIIYGMNGRKTLGTIGLPIEGSDFDAVKMDKIMRENLGVDIGGTVNISKVSQLKEANYIRLVPIAENFTYYLINKGNYIPNFDKKSRPVFEGDIVLFWDDSYKKYIEFSVCDCDPWPACIVTSKTKINLAETPVKRSVSVE